MSFADVHEARHFLEVCRRSKNQTAENHRLRADAGRLVHQSVPPLPYRGTCRVCGGLEDPLEGPAFERGKPGWRHLTNCAGRSKR
jgi:hypothetical protein